MFLLNIYKLIDLAKTAALNAGYEILKDYKKDLQVKNKIDGSPVTLADKKSHKLICEILKPSKITIVSEEGDCLHIDSKKYWLIDPLDGTKDFIAGNDEFTVNIALIISGVPVLGVVYAPAKNLLFWGAVEIGSYFQSGENIQTLKEYPKSKSLKMAVSRFHKHDDTSLFAKANNVHIEIPIGASLKYCFLATAEVDVFPRLVGSSEWDVAAGHAILNAIGGKVLDWHTGKELKYGKLNRRNPRLISFRSSYAFPNPKESLAF